MDEKKGMQKRRVEYRMLEWKCGIENPPRKGPLRVTTSSTPAAAAARVNHVQNSQQLLDKLPKIIGFGSASGGAGAVRRSPSGRIQTDIRGHPDIRYHQRDSSIFERSMRYQLDKEQIRRYKEDLDKQMEEYHKSTPGNAVGGEKNTDLATLMTSSASNYMRRWESLPKLTSTDVTRNYVNYPRTPDPEKYKRGLELQLEAKRSIQADVQRQEQALDSLHFSAFDNFWGKPGSGAPKVTTRKENLFNLLHQSGVPASSNSKN